MNNSAKTRARTKGSPPPASSPLWQAVGLLNRALVLCIVLWLIAWAIWGDGIAYLGFLNGAGFVWGVLALISAVLFLVRKSWVWGVGATVLAVAILSHGTGFQTSSIGASGQAKTDNSVRIVSASLRGRNEDMADAARVLAGTDADIITVQEVSDKDALLQELERASGAKWNVVSRELLSIYAKAPLTAKPEAEVSHVLRAIVDLDGREFDIWTLRAPKNYARPIENSRFYVGLERLIAAEKPDAVTGDFNATAWNSGYSRVEKHMINAQSAAGFGFGNSFPSDGRRTGIFGALARIDHIFVSQANKPVAAFTGAASEGADHHPVIADIVWGN